MSVALLKNVTDIAPRMCFNFFAYNGLSWSWNKTNETNI